MELIRLAVYIESIITCCINGERESYECQRSDGDEGKADALGSDDALTFRVVYDLLFRCGFDNVAFAAEYGDEDAEEMLASPE